jgi:hypothetical protein
LARYAANTRDSETLGKLFALADTNVPLLLSSLDDADESISLAAQRVIRYSGNSEGLAGLQRWYQQRAREAGVFPVTGPITFHLQTDRRQLDILLRSPSAQDPRTDQFILALALDASPASQVALQRLSAEAKFPSGTTAQHALDVALSRDATRTCHNPRELQRWLPRNAFFLSKYDSKYTSARVLAYNSAQTKILAALYVNRGVLAEEWYHVVLEDTGNGWRIARIDQVAVS